MALPSESATYESWNPTQTSGKPQIKGGWGASSRLSIFFKNKYLGKTLLKTDQVYLK